MALGAQGYIDIHTGDGLSPAAEVQHIIDGMLVAGDNGTRFSIWETNTGSLHDMKRAFMEATDLAILDMVGPAIRVDSRTASFCLEKSGHDDVS